LNGKNIIDFNDTFEERLRKVSPAGLRNTDYDVYAVAISDLSNNENLFTFRSAGKGLRAGATLGGLGGYFYGNDAAVPSSAGGTFTWDANPHIAAWAFDGSAISIFRDGTVDPTISDKDIPDAPTSIYFINLCTNDFSAGRFDGVVAEFIITPHLSPEDRQKMEGHLAHKWGLTASLPEDHPFKYRPPTDSSLAAEDWDPSDIAMVAWYDGADADTVERTPVNAGLLDLTANGGINPNTGALWKIGDKYRMAFVSSTVRDATSSNIADYNNHVQAAAAAAGLGAITWKAFVSTPTVAAQVNTDMVPGVSTDSALFNMASQTVKENLAGLFTSPPALPNKINRFENGAAVSSAPDLPGTAPFFNYTPVWTGCAQNGSALAGKEVGGASVSLGICEAEDDFQWRRADSAAVTEQMYILAISEVLIISQASTDVQQWNDKSGNARHAIQSVASQRPTTRIRTINGRNALDFDDTAAESMDIASRLGLGADPDLCVVAVLASDDDPATGFGRFLQIGAGNGSLGISYEQDQLSWRYIDGMVKFDIAGDATAHIAVFTRAAGDQYAEAKAFLDGVELTSTGSTNGTAVPADVTDSALLNVDSTVGMNGAMGEIIVLEGASQTTRQQIEGYLAHKWGLTANLPADHPYKAKKPQRTKLWTPNDIATAAWYDAAYTSTITDEGAGAVSAWNDRSGNANHLVQATPAQRPTITGKTVAFGLDDNMDFTTPLGATYYMFVVGAPRANTAIRTLLYTSAGNQPFVVNTGGDDVGHMAPGFTGASGIAWAEAERALIGFVPGGNAYQKNGGALSFVFSGSPDDQATALGGNAGTDSEGFGDVNEVLIVPVPLDSDTIYKIEGYLAWKWGFPHQLPDTHPYKRRPPMI